MSADNHLLPDLIFYVEEHGDDFTFYLAKDEGDTVVQNLKHKSSRKTGTAATTTDEAFSFADMVFVKTLKFTEDTLNLSSDFLAKLDTPAREPRHEFLLAKLRAYPATSNLSSPLAELDEKNQKKVRDALITILNEAVEEGSVQEQPWSAKAQDDVQKFLASLSEGDKKRRWTNRLILEQTFSDLIWPTLQGRGLVCRSFVGEYLSVTFRKVNQGEGYVEFPPKPVNRKKRLFSLSEYYKLIYREVFEKTGSATHAQGLVVITGSTKSAKSQIARGLIHSYLQPKIDLYLEDKSGNIRRPHLVTFEDPVEQFFTKKQRSANAYHLLADNAANIDYTPRQKETDAGPLEKALSDALRQTPALFFVGETRDKDEWRVLLNFAATGHLIVTTAHAGSLVEAMHKIFEAVDVTTAADRSEVASKLLGIIHLRSHDLSFEVAGKKTETNALFPALWRRTPRGIAALTSDGLASLLPYRPKDDSSDGPSCLGRRWLIQEIAEHGPTRQQLEDAFQATLDPLMKRAYAKAAEWDLRGV